MIYIDRDRLDEYGQPIKPDQIWFDGADAATLVAKRERAEHEVNRNIYADDQVKAALLKLFHYKCAYCESELHNVERDVEHYRPKGAVEERPDHPGYYWLAYKWENLLPSCKFCNQRRWELMGWNDGEPIGIGGKAKQFPLAQPDGELTRVMAHDDANTLENEATLLINPCDEDPKSHIWFDPTGRIFGSSEKGVVTIKICFINRRDLITLRRDVVATVVKALEALQIVRDRAIIEAVVPLEEIIQSYQADEYRYAALARYIVAHPSAFGL